MFGDEQPQAMRKPGRPRTRSPRLLPSTATGLDEIPQAELDEIQRRFAISQDELDEMQRQADRLMQQCLDAGLDSPG